MHIAWQKSTRRTDPAVTGDPSSLWWVIGHASRELLRLSQFVDFCVGHTDVEAVLQLHHLTSHI